MTDLKKIAELMDDGFCVKGRIGKYVNTRTPKDGSDKWKMLTFTIEKGDGKYIKRNKCIAWDNKKLGVTVATDNADLQPGDEVIVFGDDCKNNEYKNKEGILVHSPQFTVTAILRLSAAQKVETDDIDDDVDDVDDTFL